MFDFDEDTAPAAIDPALLRKQRPNREGHQTERADGRAAVATP